MHWNKFFSILTVSVVASLITGCTPTETPKPTPTFRAGDDCSTLGTQIEFGDMNFECRYSDQQKLHLVALKGDNSAPKDAKNLSPLDICKIQDIRESNIQGGANTGQATSFPLINNRIPVSGNIRVGVIPIDFENAPSDQSVSELMSNHIKQFDEWMDFTTNGLAKYEWVMSDNWIRMPLPAEYYNWDHPYVNPDGTYRYGDAQLQSDDEMATQVFSMAEQYYDLDSLDYIWVVAPPKTNQVQWAPQGSPRQVSTPSGTRTLNYFGLGYKLWNDQASRIPVWAIMSHEMLHAHGLAQHAPGNGYSLHIGGSGTILGAWDSLLLGWRSEESFACFDATTSNETEIDLASIDLESNGYKAAVIKLSDHEVIVIESRRQGPYSTNISPGTAGVIAYVVDSSKPSLRFDNDFSREKEYFSYFLSINQPHKNPINFGNAFIAQSSEPINMTTDRVALIGDTFSYGGVNISLTQSADYDTITISK